jgi:hypothetical protein
MDRQGQSVGKEDAKIRHGMSRTKTYRSWAGAKSRCCNQNSPSYSHYGGRGIKMCERWLNSFLAFYEDMGDCPEYSYWGLDRIDNDGDYEPGNCRWAEPYVQANNRRPKLPVKREWFTTGMDEWVKRGLQGVADERGVKLHALIEQICKEYLATRLAGKK